MKVMSISFAVGVFVGILYGVIRVKSPAPPIIALLGLLGNGAWRTTRRLGYHKESQRGKCRRCLPCRKTLGTAVACATCNIIRARAD